MKRRPPLGIGIINFAYWLAKNDTSYQASNLELVDKWAEALELLFDKSKCRLGY